MKRHKIDSARAVETCSACGASRYWVKRQPWLLNGKPQPFCTGYEEYKEKNYEAKPVPVL